MNKLFQYRLILILAQMLLLLINSMVSVWHLSAEWLWYVCWSYFLLVMLLWWFKPDSHYSRYMVLFDLLLWVLFFYALEGVSNPLIWCLLIPSVLTALHQSVGFTWSVTLLANLLYLLLWNLQPQDSIHQGHGIMMQQHITGMWFGFIVISLFLTWITTTLMQRIKAKNTMLISYQKKQQADENIIKMATLATSLAHELGTPLASIKLLVDELNYSASNDEQVKDLKMLDSQVMRCKKVLAELTAVTDKSHVGDIKVMKFKEFVGGLIQTLDSEFCDIKLHPSIANKTMLNVDTLLRLAFMNVLNNSIAAGAKVIDINSEMVDEFLSIKFEDDGQGEAHQSSTGLGIGLKLSSRIIESLGGKLSTNMMPAGTVSTISLPVTESNYD